MDRTTMGRTTTGRVVMGSELTHSMLKDGHQKIWCAVSDESDKNAMEDQEKNGLTSMISSFEDGKFYCTSGMAWRYAVPIKITALTRIEVNY